MHLFKQHAVKDFAEAVNMIPVIDYGPYFAGEPGALERLAEEVRYAGELGHLHQAIATVDEPEVDQQRLLPPQRVA